ncbi:MAG: hypothetical protein ACFFAU_12350 [Candidatus Hodarchaeota archaeon]
MGKIMKSIKILIIFVLLALSFVSYQMFVQEDDVNFLLFAIVNFILSIGLALSSRIRKPGGSK